MIRNSLTVIVVLLISLFHIPNAAMASNTHIAVGSAYTVAIQSDGNHINPSPRVDTNPLAVIRVQQRQKFVYGYRLGDVVSKTKR